MTTILKALQELERRDTLTTPPTALCAGPHRTLRTLRWGVIAAVLLALVGGAFGGAFIFRGRSTRSAVSTEGASEVHRSAVAPSSMPQQVAPPQPLPAPPRASSAKNELPPARVEKRRPAARAASGSAPPARSAPARKRAAPHAPASGLRVESITYSRDLAERAVSVRINDAQTVTLREGESADGVEVQLILPNTVYLRQGGSVFAVDVAR